MNRKARDLCRALSLYATLVSGPGAIAAATAGNNPEPIVLGNAEELQAAMIPENAGKHFVLQSGTYMVAAPLVVPDGVTLEGEGTMLGDGLPSGFATGTESAIVAEAGFSGDLLTLGDGARLDRLFIEYAAGGTGNVVVVGSRAAGDSVSAAISDCEILNPNPPGIGLQGPIGRGVVVTSRNPNAGDAPPPHAGAEISLWMRRTIVHSEGGGPAVFGINFAPRAHASLVLQYNVLGGGLDMVGGVSRPDEVIDSAMMVVSDHNLYRAEAAVDPDVGVRVIGGSGVPIPGVPAPGASDNFAFFDSTHDRVVGFPTGIVATGGRRMNDVQGPSSGNTVDLRLRGLVVRTVATLDAPARDFTFVAAQSDAAEPEFLPGDRNSVSVRMHDTVGSGLRDNVYADVLGPQLPENQGERNRLRFIGTRPEFRDHNTRIRPAPAAEYFQRLRRNALGL